MMLEPISLTLVVEENCSLLPSKINETYYNTYVEVINGFISHYESENYYSNQNFQNLRREIITRDFEPEKIEILSIGYISCEELESWEHEKTHNISKRNLKIYYEQMLPLICEVTDEGIKLIEDGNHRLNTLKKYEKDIPIILVSNQIDGKRLRCNNNKLWLQVLGKEEES